MQLNIKELIDRRKEPDFLDYLQKQLPFEIKDMEKLNHQLENLFNMETLSQEETEILFLALLLNNQLQEEEDAGDRYFTKPNQPVQRLRKALWKAGLFNQNRDLREAALRLAALRNLPEWIFKEENPQESLGMILSDGELIKAFDKKLILDFLKLIDTDQENLEKIENLLPEYQPQQAEGTEVIMLAGLPASGKDTFIARNLPGMDVVSLDDIRVEKNISPVGDQSEVVRIAKQRAVDHLKQKIPFVWNATSLTKKLRKQQYDLFKKYGGKVKIIYLETDFNRLLDRNEKRDATVPEEAIDRMMNIIDPPSRFEADEVEWILS